MRVRNALAGFCLAGAAMIFVPAMGQGLRGHNSHAPVDVTADHGEAATRQGRASFSGNVRVLQDGLVLETQRLTVAYAGGTGGVGGIDIVRIDAAGGVVVRKGDQTARGDAAVYDLDRGIVTMVGGVVLQQGVNRVSGGRLVIDLNSGRSVIDGGAVGASGPNGPGQAPGGRVTGHFTVPQKTSGR